MFHDQEHVRTSHLELRHKAPENMVLLYSPLSALRQYLASSIVAVWAQAEDKDGETPLSVAATRSLRQALVDVATGKKKAEEFLDEELMNDE